VPWRRRPRPDRADGHLAFVGDPVANEDVLELLEGIETGVAEVLTDVGKFL